MLNYEFIFHTDMFASCSNENQEGSIFGKMDNDMNQSSSSEYVNKSWKNIAMFMKKHNLTDCAGGELLKL